MATTKNMPSPILLYGDSRLSKDIIVRAKKKYDDAHWITLPAKEDDDTDSIRAELGSLGWDDVCKVVIINNLANRKNMREFLLKMAKEESEVKLIIWDSDNVIKVDPKTNSVSAAAWKPFVKEFESFGKVVNSGAAFTIKESTGCVSYVKEGFKKRGLSIDNTTANLFVTLVGFDRGLLTSEIDKLCLIALSDTISYQFILEHTFRSSKEAVLYVLSNALDKDSEEDCICIIEEFMGNGVNENVIAEILVNKARWQLVVADLFSKGKDWEDISRYLMSMGKFPSDGSGKHDTLLSAIEYLCTERNVPKKYFAQVMKKSDKKTKMKKGASLPMPFMAYDTVKFVRTQILSNYTSEMAKTEAKEFLLTRAFKVYNSLQEKLFDVRRQKFVKANLYAMVRDLKDPNLQ